jgi:hypothetical protein
MTDTPSEPVVNARQGKAWSAEEDQQLYDRFAQGTSVDALASAHGRSAGGIRARLGRLGLVDPNGEVVTPTPPFVPVQRRPPADSGTGVAAGKETATRSVFAVRTGDGWAVDLRSNRPLSRALVDRLTSMLRGILPEDEEQ